MAVGQPGEFKLYSVKGGFCRVMLMPRKDCLAVKVILGFRFVVFLMYVQHLDRRARLNMSNPVHIGRVP